MVRVWKNPTQFPECNWRFYQQMELVNAPENAAAATGRTDTCNTGRTATYATGNTKEGNTSRKGEGKKKGWSTVSSVEDNQKGTTAVHIEVEAITEGKLCSVYGYVM